MLFNESWSSLNSSASISSKSSSLSVSYSAVGFCSSSSLCSEILFSASVFSNGSSLLSSMESQDCISSVSRFFFFVSTSTSTESVLAGGGVSAMQLLGRKASSLLTSSPLKIALIFRTLFSSSSSSELLDPAFSNCLRGIPMAVLGLPLLLLVRSLNGSGGGGGHPWTGTQSPVSLFTIWTLAPTLLPTNWTSWSSLDSSSIGSEAKIALILAIMSSCFFVAANLSLSSMINRSFFANKLDILVLLGLLFN